MIGLTFLYTLAAAPLLSLAAPTDANIALARKYAPQFRFEKGEKFFGSSIEYFLSGPITPKDGNGNTVGGGISLNAANLNTLPNSGDGVFLDTPTDSAALNGFLAGQNPTNNNGARVYTFVAPKANNVVDLFYWLFTPYNLAKTVPVLGQVGNHVGDWERLKVRTVNGTATQVEYHAHGDTGSGTIPWDQVAKFDNNQRPVGYVASGSHGFWATPGTFTYVNAVIFQLQDVTSDGGVYWDTKDSLSIINYPDTYTGDLGWLTYRGRWGSKGTTDCWWHFIYSECERVDAPNGPLRDDVLGVASLTGSPMPAASGDMDIPMMQTLATLSRSPNSRYTVYSKTVATQFVGIRQTCTAGSDGNAGHPTQNIDFPTNGTVVKRADPEPESQYKFASVAAPKKAGRIDLTVTGCPEGFAITGYSFGPCSGKTADACNFLPTRAIRAYAPGVQGVQAARAVEVEDLDFW